MCMGCGSKASYRVVIEDLSDGHVAHEIYLCETCMALKFVSMRPYLARAKPRVFDALVCEGLI